MRPYRVKCSWHATSFNLIVWATSPEDALKRAKRNKNARTATSFTVLDN